MALQYRKDGEAGGLVLTTPALRISRLAVEDFATSFAVRLKLKSVPSDSSDFCPFRATEMIISCLRQVTRSLPLLRLRVTYLVTQARRIQSWFRAILHAREQTFQKIYDHWASSDSSQKKALQSELYRDSKLRPAAVRLRLRSYAKLHNTEEAMRAAVAALYWERSKEFTRQFRFWFAGVRAVRQERD
eukprot:RCo024040